MFPFLTLLISGGHTLLLLATSIKSFRILATTSDESIGRSFDKVSRLLNLKWSTGGPGVALERFCEEAVKQNSPQPKIPPAPLPMPRQLGFSYSALHSYVERYIHNRGGIDKIELPERYALASEFQRAATGQLEEKLLLAINQCKSTGIPIRHVVMSGGVASNQYIREKSICSSFCLSLDLDDTLIVWRTAWPPIFLRMISPSSTPLPHYVQVRIGNSFAWAAPWLTSPDRQCSDDCLGFNGSFHGARLR